MRDATADHLVYVATRASTQDSVRRQAVSELVRRVRLAEQAMHDLQADALRYKGQARKEKARADRLEVWAEQTLRHLEAERAARIQDEAHHAEVRQSIRETVQDILATLTRALEARP